MKLFLMLFALVLFSFNLFAQQAETPVTTSTNFKVQFSEELNEKLSDENLTSDWVAYRTLAHDSKVIEEQIEELMLKLESF